METAIELYRHTSEISWPLQMHPESEDLRCALTAERRLLRLLAEQGEKRTLEVELRECIERRNSALPDNHPQRAYARQQLADVLMAQDRYPEAKKLLLEASGILRAQPLVPKVRIDELDEQLASVHESLDGSDEAEHRQDKVGRVE